MKRKFWKPGIGQLVRLSREGFDTVSGLRTQQEVEAQKNGFRVTRISKAHTTPECWNVCVDGPLQHRLLNSADLEPFPGAEVVQSRPGDDHHPEEQELEDILFRDGIAFVDTNGNPHAVFGEVRRIR